MHSRRETVSTTNPNEHTDIQQQHILVAGSRLNHHLRRWVGI
jgi:hypothetical protein